MQIAPRWTDDLDAILTDGLLAGKTFSQIALTTHKTRNACIGRAHRLHLTADSRAKFWTAENTELVCRWRAEKVKVAEIARRLQCTHSAAMHKVKRLRRQGLIAVVPPIPAIMPATPQKRLSGANGHDDAALARKIERMASSGPPRAPSEPLKPMTERFAEGYLGQTGRVSLMELRDGITCKFPIVSAGAGAVRYCGDTVAERSVYCHHHSQRVRQA